MNYIDYQYVIQQAQFGFAYHEIILDASGNPIDYRFLEANLTFENLTGLKVDTIKGKTAREILPGIENSEFNWIAFYGNIALNGGNDAFEQYSEQLGRWFNVKVYSPEKNHFATLFVDVTREHNFTEASRLLNQYTFENIDYNKIADQMLHFSGAQFAVLNKFEKNERDFTTVGTAGMNTLFEKAARLMGFSLEGKKWKYDPLREARIRNSKVTYFKHLPDLNGNSIPKEIVDMVVEMTQTGTVVIVKTVQDEKMVGDFTLIFKKGQELENKWLVESYADMVGMVLGRVDAEAEMANQKAIIEDFFMVNLDLLCIADSHGNFEKLNREWEVILGYPLEELQCRNFLEFVHPEDIVATRESMARLGSQKQIRNFVNRYRCKDGTYRYLEWRSHPHGKWIYAAARDITERIRSEESLRASEEKFAAAFRHAPVLIAINDMADGTYVEVNEESLRVSGFARDEVIGKTADDIGWLLLRHRLRILREYRVKGRVTDMEMEFTARDGRRIEGLVNAEKIIVGGKECLLTMTVDITLRKEAERELMRAKEKAEESDRLKSAFLANMSHEIRTPMNGILGFAELLKEPELSGEEQQKYIRVIEKSGARMLNIINDIIDISRIEAGQTEVSLAPTNINQQMEFLCTFFKPEVELKGVSIGIEESLPAGLAQTVTDREKLYAILTNLIKNAVKFTLKGSITIGCRLLENEFEFYVKDTGPGIRHEKKDVIFERFRQGHEQLSRSHHGAGLGLAISKAYVEMLGGRIWLETSPGIGSTFYFTLPRRVARTLADDSIL